MSSPIYDEFSKRFGYEVPEKPDWFNPATTMLPIVVSGVSRAAGVAYAGYCGYPATPPEPDLVDVPPRVDDWCEDRPPDDLTANDGAD